MRNVRQAGILSPSRMAALASLATVAFAACAQNSPKSPVPADPVITAEVFRVQAGKPVASRPGERWFRNVRQLTFGGENAEAYWSADGKHLILQARSGDTGFDCDQIFTLDLTTGERKLVSTGKGRTTCAYYLQGDDRIVYASTHLAGPNCPPPVARVRGRYVWPIYAGYDVFTAKPDGSDLVRITDTPGYDAEATVCPVSGRIVFTSVRDGDLELYAMEPDGSDVTRLTNRVGYDGGAFYSHDGKKLVLRSGFPENEAAEKEYLEFLGQGLVVPSHMEITVCDRDGSNFRKVTSNGKANFGPFWHPDNRRIIFSSNMDAPRGRDFELYLIGDDGKGLTRITYNPAFDGFPMFSPDGRLIVFASNRYAKERGETNVFVAEWVEDGSVDVPPAPPVMAPADASAGGGRPGSRPDGKRPGGGN